MGTSVTYPDGSTLVSSALTLAQINALMVPLTLSMLGFASTAVDPNSGQVRIEWQTLGAPFPKVTEDICFLACVPKDDPYNRIRDRANLPGPSGELVEQWNYTRAWSIRFCHYGPNSLDLARAVRSAMYQDCFTNQLAQGNLFPVSDFPEVIRVPEEINGQWFERADLDIEMYEEITETIDRQTVLSVQVILVEPQGQIGNFTILPNATQQQLYEQEWDTGLQSMPTTLTRVQGATRTACNLYTPSYDSGLQAMEATLQTVISSSVRVSRIFVSNVTAVIQTIVTIGDGAGNIYVSDFELPPKSNMILDFGFMKFQNGVVVQAANPSAINFQIVGDLC